MFPALVFAASGTSPARIAQTVSAEPVYSALAGAWVGALEYRDYSSNGHVLLPTILDIRLAKDGQAVVLHYIYDDGPTKVVQDSETVAIDCAAGTYTTVSEDGTTTDKDALIGLPAFLKARQGRLVRMGKGEENDKPVDVRTTLTLTARYLTILKETRLSGSTFQFRDQYKMMRVLPGTTGK